MEEEDLLQLISLDQLCSLATSAAKDVGHQPAQLSSRTLSSLLLPV